jgi:hypothetical protein
VANALKFFRRGAVRCIGLVSRLAIKRRSGIYNLGAAGGSSFEISTTQRLLTGDLSYGVGVGVGVSVKVLSAAGTVCLTAELPST